MRVLVVILLLAGATGCASAGQTSSTTNRTVLTLEEIERAEQPNAYQLIQVHRPWWLRKRGPTSFTRDNPIHVYMSGTRLGDLEELRSISRLDIRELRYLSAAQAQTRYGTGNVSGAIEVLLRQ